MSLSRSLMPGFHHSVAVLPLPLRKFRKNSAIKRRKNYVAYVKNSVAPLPFQLPLRRNRRSVANMIESYCCCSSVAGQSITVLVIVQTASTERRFHQFRSHAQRQRNYGNGTTERRNGKTATEWWNLETNGCALLHNIYENSLHVPTLWKLIGSRTTIKKFTLLAHPVDQAPEIIKYRPRYKLATLDAL